MIDSLTFAELYSEYDDPISIRQKAEDISAKISYTFTNE